MLRQLRKSLNISQGQLALKLGKSQAVVSMWENNITKPSLSSINKLAEILKVSEQTIIDCFKENDCEHSGIKKA